MSQARASQGTSEQPGWLAGSSTDGEQEQSMAGERWCDGCPINPWEEGEIVAAWRLDSCGLAFQWMGAGDYMK